MFKNIAIYSSIKSKKISQLSDQVDIQSDDSKSFEVGISEGVQLGDGSP